MAAIKFGALFVFVFCTMPFLYPGRPKFVVLGVLDFSDIFPSLQALLLQRNDMWRLIGPMKFFRFVLCPAAEMGKAPLNES